MLNKKKEKNNKLLKKFIKINTKRQHTENKMYNMSKIIQITLINF